MTWRTDNVESPSPKAGINRIETSHTKHSAKVQLHCACMVGHSRYVPSFADVWCDIPNKSCEIPWSIIKSSLQDQENGFDLLWTVNALGNSSVDLRAFWNFLRDCGCPRRTIEASHDSLSGIQTPHHQGLTVCENWLYIHQVRTRISRASFGSAWRAVGTTTTTLCGRGCDKTMRHRTTQLLENRLQTYFEANWRKYPHQFAFVCSNKYWHN